MNYAKVGAAALCAILLAAYDHGDLPPVEDTKPSTDVRILEDDGRMSDGTQLILHETTTVNTTVPIVSNGVIGGLSVDREGNIYNANFRESIWRTSPDGTTVLLSDEFKQASGNFPLDNGDLLQADFKENKIYRITPDGSRSVFSEGGLDGPVGMIQLGNGDFIVANYRGKYLARIGQDGGAAKLVLQDERLQGPNGLTLDRAGNIYIADLKSPIVFKWTPVGELIELTELPGKGNAHNVYASGRLYVNKIWDHVVYLVDLETGAFGIVAGNGRAGYSDGLTGFSTIEEPNGIAASPDGKIVYFNTHRGKMSGPIEMGLIIVRRMKIRERN